MRLKAIVKEDFTNYKEASLFLGTCFCTWKCCHEANIPESVCQNNALAISPIIEKSDEELIEEYLKNDITSAIVFGGLEPILQLNEILHFINTLRNKYNRQDIIIVYTGYYPQEIQGEITKLQQFKNIIVKFGRYKPGDSPHLDPVLGVKLASNNQFAEKIS